MTGPPRERRRTATGLRPGPVASASRAGRRWARGVRSPNAAGDSARAPASASGLRVRRAGDCPADWHRRANRHRSHTAVPAGRGLRPSRVGFEANLKPRLVPRSERVPGPGCSRGIRGLHSTNSSQDLRDELFRFLGARGCRIHESGEHVVLLLGESKAPKLFGREPAQDVGEREPLVEAEQLSPRLNLDRLGRKQLDPEPIDMRRRRRVRYT